MLPIQQGQDLESEFTLGAPPPPGMVCIYKSDFFKIGGFDTTRAGWGGEDLALVKKTVKAGKYKIIR